MDRRTVGTVDARWRLRRVGGAPGFRGLCATPASGTTQPRRRWRAPSLVDGRLLDRARRTSGDAVRPDCKSTRPERLSGVGLSSPGRAATARRLRAPRELAAPVHLDPGRLLVLRLGW